MTTRWGLGYRMGDGYTRLQTTSIRLGPVRLLRRAPHLRCGAACLCRWPARGCWEEGVPAAGGEASRVAGARAPTHVVAGGGIRRRRGRESGPRTRGLSPAGRRRTRPRGMSPAGVGDAVASGRRGSARSAPVPPAPSAELPGVRLEDVGCERSPSPSKTHVTNQIYLWYI